MMMQLLPIAVDECAGTKIYAPAGEEGDAYHHVRGRHVINGVCIMSACSSDWVLVVVL